MQHKYEWRKEERSLYLPGNRPEQVEVPDFDFITIRGTGSPAGGFFAEKVAALYALAYTIKMAPKKMACPPSEYFDFTVYPLEGVWDISEEAKADSREKWTRTISSIGS